MKKIDRIILAVIAAALTVIAMNPWVAPGYVSAQGGKVDVNIAEFGLKALDPPDIGGRRLPGIPVIILNK
ncbi:MAG: hypothetical protein HYZ11_19055 [Candidatus Tectomicrobia bacterium]|uniref:Uncharacterized protein n=1 Tax=Tectimicrobiota bacterium TaxID=2528274 RepID=A0A932I5M9_UNCTE|nr:hypothetical protein [Candidatus Tectomicrobia bacterium]